MARAVSKRTGVECVLRGGVDGYYVEDGILLVSFFTCLGRLARTWVYAGVLEPLDADAKGIIDRAIMIRDARDAAYALQRALKAEHA